MHATTSRTGKRPRDLGLIIAAALIGVLIPNLAMTRAARAQCPPGQIPMQVWDVIVREGRPWMFSIRTCQPQGLQQGTILLKRPLAPLPRVRKARLFANPGDMDPPPVFTVEPGADGTELSCWFSAFGPDVNTAHGPLLALLMAKDLPGERPEVLRIDGGRTELIDDQGLPVLFCPLDGTFSVVAEDAPFVLDVRDHECRAENRTVLMPLATYELWPMTQLETTLYYDETFFSSIDLSETGTIVWDYLDNIEYEIDTSMPGAVHIRMISPEAGINVLPGPFIEIMFNLAPHVEVGDETQLSLSPLHTKVEFKNGESPQIELRPGTLRIIQ